ncbi:MAG: hypothetical protein WCK33_03780 [Phycisphaerae bacterium]
MNRPTIDPRLPAGAATTGDGAIFVATFINSLGTGVVTNGIFFLTSGAYGFSRTQNYLLGIILGLTYIAGALATGPCIARLRRRGVSSRTLLLVVCTALASLCVIPWAARRGGIEGSWPIWTLVVLYSPLTGVLWPVVEGYLSGGKSGGHLRAVMGRWNVVWSSAVVLSYWFMSPLIERHASETILLLGLLHLGSAGLIAKTFAAEPGEHPLEAREPHPAVYAHLLVTLRILLPVAYVVSSTLGPYLPGALTGLGVTAWAQTLVASLWLAPRVITFLLMERWQGWHGRWSIVVVATALLVGGFTLAVLAPLGVRLGCSNAACLATLMAGLVLFGTGMACIYTGALYYAMEVGEAEIDSGGHHEALIGLGYAVGPLCGILPSLAASRGMMPPDAFQPVVLGAVFLILVLATGVVSRRIHALTRTPVAP